MTIPRPSEAVKAELQLSMQSRESNGKQTIGKWSRKSSVVHGTGDKNVIPLGQLKWHSVKSAAFGVCPIPMAHSLWEFTHPGYCDLQRNVELKQLKEQMWYH